MRLRQLRFLVAVYEEGTFTAAASRVHATQSGISAQIKQLEESLGSTLFERSATGVAATRAGQLAYEHAIRILREADALKSDIELLDASVSGSVSAGLMPTTARSVIAPVLDRFAASYPNIEVKLEEAYSAHLCEGVMSGRLDFALVPPSNTQSGLRSTFLARDTEVFVTAPDTDVPHLSSVDLTSMQALKLVLPGSENSRRGKIEESIRTYNLRVEKIMELDAMMATLDLVARSDWTSILPGCLLVEDITSNQRNLHPISKPAMSLDYVLVEPAAKSLSPAAQLLCDELQAELVQVCNRCQAQFAVH